MFLHCTSLKRRTLFCMTFQKGLDITEHIQRSGLAERILPYIIGDHFKKTREVAEFIFSLSTRDTDRGLMLDIAVAGTEKKHRSMHIDTHAKRLGLSIDLSAREVTALIWQALPILTAPDPNPPYTPKKALAA